MHNNTTTSTIKHHDQRSLIMMLLIVFTVQMGWSQEQEGSGKVDSATPSWFSQMDISGTYHFTYQFRNTGSVDDNDLFQYLSLNVKNVWKDRIDMHFSMLWHEDLDDDSDLRSFDNFDPFLDIDQANNNAVRVFTGYANVKDLVFDDSELRLGRQYFEEIDHVHFDGAAYTFEPIDRLEVALFGGEPVAFYSSTAGDAVYGTNLAYRFTPQTKAALRYYRYDADPFTDDLAAAEIWHLLNQSIQAHAEFSLLDGKPYILQGDLLTRFDAIDLDTTFQIVHLFESIADQTLNFNPVFPLLNSHEPFTRVSVNTIKGMGDYWSLTAGIDVLEAEQADAVTNFTNRDFQRYSAGVEVYPIETVTVSVSGEYWDVDPNDEFTGITGEVEYEPTPKWTLSAGVDYGEYVQEFRDEFLFNFGDNSIFRVSPDVITYFSRVRWKPRENVFSNLWFEVEDNDVDQDEFYSVRVELGIHF